mgnify:CR=1 FL=1
MKHKTTYTQGWTSFLAAGLFALTPIMVSPAHAQSDSIPYEIRFDGQYTPANLQTVGYPFIAGSQKQNGECLLSITTNTQEEIVAMSVMSCTAKSFEAEAEKLIEAQTLADAAQTELTAHALRIKWKIGEEVEADYKTMARR